MLFLQSEQGQSLTEYGMVLVLVAAVIVFILIVLGPQIGNLYSRIVVCVPPTPLCQ